MLPADATTAPAEVGRRVFIKGLAATGALVGGLAVAGPASAQEAGGVPARGRRPSPFTSGAGPASPASSSTTFPRPDFVGEAELPLDDGGRVAEVVFRAP